MSQNNDHAARSSIDEGIIRKYNRPVLRYTSYPTALKFCTIDDDDSRRRFDRERKVMARISMELGSRGTIRITSPDPFSAPEIQPNYLATQGDRDTMLAGMNLARRVIAQPAIAPLVRREVFPGPEVADDAAMAAYVRETGRTIFHPTSTCRMGTDANAVVDDRLRVRGVSGLRVADASIMPTVVSGNTNAPAIMIGEKCAHMILEDTR